MTITQVNVHLCFSEKQKIFVGRLARKNNEIYFEYDGDFLTKGLPISPLHLPLQPGLFKGDKHLFEGLFGVFNDSLPDGWGRLLLDRKWRSKGFDPQTFSALDRLCDMGSSCIGALEYYPDHSNDTKIDVIDLKDLSSKIQHIQKTDIFFEDIYRLNGSSAGARPKALIGVNETHSEIIEGTGILPEGFKHYIVKFPNTQDDKDAGIIEYAYSLMAKDAGIQMPNTILLQDYYFAIERFDRTKNKRHHILSACGLLNSDFRAPCLDYEDLIKATLYLTKDIQHGVEMYRRAVFNVMAHNQDDHSKNFSYLMNSDGTWMLSPAYDLTLSSGPYGEQSSTILGEGKNITKNHLLELAKYANINKNQASDIIDKTAHALNKAPTYFLNLGLSRYRIQQIQKQFLLYS